MGYHPQAANEPPTASSDARSVRRTLSSRCDPSVTCSPWFLLEERRPSSYLQPAPRLGDLKPCSTKQARPRSSADPPSPSQVSDVLRLGAGVASGCYPTANHRMYESWTRHSRRMKVMEFHAFSPGRRGKVPGIPRWLVFADLANFPRLRQDSPASPYGP